MLYMFILYCCLKMSEKNLEQWNNISFCVKIDKSANEMLFLLKMASSEHAMKKSNAFE